MAYWSKRSRHEQAWDWLLNELRPDIALCQECVPPDWVSRERTVLWERAYPPDSKQSWGTAVVSSLPTTEARLPELDDWLEALPSYVPGKEQLAGIHRADGWLQCAQIELPRIGPVLTGSLHNPSYPIERGRLESVNVSDIKLKNNNDVWFIDVLFYFLKRRLDRPLLVGGDFNTSRLLDDLHGNNGNHEFFDRIAAEGFVSLHRTSRSTRPATCGLERVDASREDSATPSSAPKRGMTSLTCP
ncbi:MAG: endonuclease/exonuclease/phosphatase family protein [Myxococcota bacterium]